MINSWQSLCHVTGRKARSGKYCSHAMNASKENSKLIYKKVTILVDGQPKSLVPARALKPEKLSV